MSAIDESKKFIPLNIAVLTISDTRALADDKSGATLAERLTAAGHHLAAREIIVDDVEAIRDIVRRWIADAGVDAIITTGGTGFTGRDVTPEAVEPLFEKRMDGFSIAFHMLSHAKIGASTIQSRATAGVAGATFIFCLPGSPCACRDGWDGILAAQLDYRTKPCNFVEIMPRLDEHLRRPKAEGASARYRVAILSRCLSAWWLFRRSRGGHNAISASGGLACFKDWMRTTRKRDCAPLRSRVACSSSVGERASTYRSLIVGDAAIWCARRTMPLNSLACSRT